MCGMRKRLECDILHPEKVVKYLNGEIWKILQDIFVMAKNIEGHRWKSLRIKSCVIIRMCVYSFSVRLGFDCGMLSTYRKKNRDKCLN